ncbi:bifunctional tRNA (5-methylaminomethyl-2-thiouridine)(34)-methyltransferase MnmD/FAD-dependent 5-carboxymethylaminomethyl-2-thiouridine(34) oxidoreductase MnmC [Variovorax sp. YR752]|uniref:bifunctional tRNA (5-methylaminomethyl-2-thiouridine)(34)-methyltransferase MnmD/FAD-dependent 5-carboxymethylaminomethyl-2-thiouridine(34) oxidoreductase MnmC n=1 Tax=Variovorax sp. YR752 TaxID=1884383 RepID=UPI00313802B1
MKTAPIVAAQIEPGADGLPFAVHYGDRYHPRAGALEQARHVFLGGSGLPRRWAGRERFVIAETGFGLGNNFLAAWAAWRRDEKRCERLHFLSVELHPPRVEDLLAWPRDAEIQPLADQLARQWPALTPGLHTLRFDDDRVWLQLAFGDVADWLPEWVARIDAFFLDGFAPDRNPRMWEPRLFKSLARLAAPGGTAATWSAASAVREGLQSAGFEVHKAPGHGGKRDITLAHFVPPVTRRSAPPGRPREREVDHHALVIGGGLAGCAAAWALAEQGWRSTVIERHSEPACEASGNPGGIFHGIVTRDDGLHARWHRAAALAFAPVASEAILSGVPGAVDGLLRLEREAGDAAAMAASLRRLGLPASYVEALDAAEASRRAGLLLTSPAWFYPAGGWLSPRALSAWYLRRAGALASWQGGAVVERLQRDGEVWQAVDARGTVLASSRTVVLANGAGAMRLLGAPDWPIESIRGQVSIGPAAALPLPRLPVTGSGYLLPAVGGQQAVFGATAQADDADGSVRQADHRLNIDRLAALLGQAPALRAEDLAGRVGWRCTAGDRLPVIGGAPDESSPAVGSADQPRFVPRREGLFMFTALGSRGIGMSALGARLLAAWVTAAPSPVEASLMDAVDPARFTARARRKSFSSIPAPARTA